ncbi:MAG: hypothetical protein Q9167_000385 [Letrouitia subvulpina]
MVDIGRARRKPPRNPKIDTILHLPTNLEEERVDSNGNVSDKTSRNHLTLASVDDWAVAPLALPFWDQHPLTTLEKQCGMDMFSAYGITLVLAESRNPARTTCRVDITASLLYDMKPRFPLPSDLVSTALPAESSGTVPMPLFNIMKAEPTRGKNFMSVVSCMSDLNAIVALVESQLAAKCDGLWIDEVYMGLQINLIVHRLLDRPAQATSMADCELISEALRLGAILWIIWIKRQYRSYPGPSTVYVSKLLSLLSLQHGWRGTSSDPDLLSIRLWLLVLCGISSCGTTKEQTTAVDMIARAMRQLKGNSWIGMMTQIRQMPWVNVFEDPCNELEGLVKAIC